MASAHFARPVINAGISAHLPAGHFPVSLFSFSNVIVVGAMASSGFVRAMQSQQGAR